MKLAGIAEIAEELGVSRPRAHQIADRHDFPTPEARLKMGPVYDRTKVQRWIRKHRAGISTLVALVLALCPASATAASQTDLPAMLDVAQAHLGGGCSTIEVEWAAPGTLGMGDTSHAVGRGGGCRIWLDQGWWAAQSWANACHAVAHEYGHAIGLAFPENHTDPAHSADPSHFMHAHGPTFAACDAADPTAAKFATYNDLLRRQDRIENRCVRYWRQGWPRAERRCWRRYRAADRQAVVAELALR